MDSCGFRRLTERRFFRGWLGHHVGHHVRVGGAGLGQMFVIKSYSEDDVHKSIKYGVWASTDTGNTGGEVLADTLVFQLNGAAGAETFNFGAGTSSTQIADAINLVADSTGVSALAASATGLTFTYCPPSCRGPQSPQHLICT